MVTPEQHIDGRMRYLRWMHARDAFAAKGVLLTKVMLESVLGSADSVYVQKICEGQG